VWKWEGDVTRYTAIQTGIPRQGLRTKRLSGAWGAQMYLCVYTCKFWRENGRVVLVGEKGL
jgi:hypothetical protein